jgi:hypothetical protein
MLLTDELVVLAVAYLSTDDFKMYFPYDFGSDGRGRQILYRFRDSKTALRTSRWWGSARSNVERPHHDYVEGESVVVLI